MRRAIKVPAVTDPVFCFKTPKLDAANPMLHCDRKKGHLGPHSWEYESLLRDFQAKVDEIDRLNGVLRALSSEMDALRATQGAKS